MYVKYLLISLWFNIKGGIRNESSDNTTQSVAAFILDQLTGVTQVFPERLIIQDDFRIYRKYFKSYQLIVYSFITTKLLLIQEKETFQTLIASLEDIQTDMKMLGLNRSLITDEEVIYC